MSSINLSIATVSPKDVNEYESDTTAHTKGKTSLLYSYRLTSIFKLVIEMKTPEPQNMELTSTTNGINNKDSIRLMSVAYFISF